MLKVLRPGLARLLTPVDEALDRVQGSSGPFGAFLDSTLDRVGDAAIFGGISLWLGTGGHQRVLAAVALFCLVVGGLVSYAKARAQSLGLRCDVGIAERAERLIIGLVAIGLSGLGVPYVLSAGLWILAGLSAFTFGQRVHAVRRSASDQAAGPAGSGHEAEAADAGAADAGAGAANSGSAIA